MDRTEWIKGAVLGHVVGDALGVPWEFTDRETLDASPVTDMTGNGSHRVPRGCWSDDSSMALCTLASLAERGRIDTEDIMIRFSRWLQEGYMTPRGKAFGVGRTTTKAMGRYWAGGTADRSGFRTERDNGNGSLMRILPVALFNCLHKDGTDPEEKRMRAIRRVGSLTHAHLRANLACGTYNLIFEELAAQPGKAAVLMGLARAQRRYADSREYKSYERLFRPDFAALPREAIRSSGYVVDTLEAAVWCLLTTDSYRDCMLTAVNLGGDTDTVAAVAGGLAGVLYGRQGIPDEWLEAIAKREEIEELCGRFAERMAKK